MTNGEVQIVIGNIPLKPEILDDCYSITDYQEAKAMAIEALEQTRWIPVSERLPEEGGDYLTTVSFDIGAKEPVREVYKDYFCVLSQKWLNRDEDVVAWMPLPEPYKTESGE